MNRRSQLAKRLATIAPTDLERDPVGVVVCELLVDLLDALSGGVEQAQDGGKPEDGRSAAASAAPADDKTTGGEGGSAPVQLQEPDMPPTDDTVNDTRDEATTGPAQAGKSGRPARRKTSRQQKPAAVDSSAG